MPSTNNSDSLIDWNGGGGGAISLSTVAGLNIGNGNGQTGGTTGLRRSAIRPFNSMNTSAFFTALNLGERGRVASTGVPGQFDDAEEEEEEEEENEEGGHARDSEAFIDALLDETFEEIWAANDSVLSNNNDVAAPPDVVNDGSVLLQDPLADSNGNVLTEAAAAAAAGTTDGGTVEGGDDGPAAAASTCNGRRGEAALSRPNNCDDSTESSGLLGPMLSAAGTPVGGGRGSGSGQTCSVIGILGHRVVRFRPTQASVSSVIEILTGGYTCGLRCLRSCIKAEEKERDSARNEHNAAKAKLSHLLEKADSSDVKLNVDIVVAKDEVNRAKAAYILANENVAAATEQHDDLANEYQAFLKGNANIDRRADIILPATANIGTGIDGHLLVSGGSGRGRGTGSCAYMNAKLQIMNSADHGLQQRTQRAMHCEYAREVKVSDGKAKEAKKKLAERRSDLRCAKANLANLMKEEKRFKEGNSLVDAETASAVADLLDPFITVARHNILLAESELSRANCDAENAEEELTKIVADFGDFLDACSEM